VLGRRPSALSALVGAQRVEQRASGRVEDVDLEPAAGAGLHRDENGIGGCEQWGPIVREGPGVVQINRGRPVDRIQVLDTGLYLAVC
jgi:hypothetical protein